MARRFREIDLARTVAILMMALIPCLQAHCLWMGTTPASASIASRGFSSVRTSSAIRLPSMTLPTMSNAPTSETHLLREPVSAIDGLSRLHWLAGSS